MRAYSKNKIRHNFTYAYPNSLWFKFGVYSNALDYTDLGYKLSRLPG